MIDMQIRTINFILYGIIALLLILTLTSIVNTVNGSIDNRRREFAVIKSVGIDDKSFHKMIFLESTIIAFKGIISGLVISYILVKWSMIKYNNLILVVAVDSNDMKLIEFPIKEELIGVSFILAIMHITFI